MKVHTKTFDERLKVIRFTCDTFLEVFGVVAEFVKNIPNGESRVFGAEYFDGGDSNKQIFLYLREQSG